MKKYLPLLLILVSASFGIDRVFFKGNEGDSRPVLDKTIKEYVIDSSETVTPNVYFDLTGLPMASWVDTIGYLWFQCADSAGTDSIAGKVTWSGNPRADGLAKWVDIGSVTMTAGTGTTFLQTGAPVILDKRYMAIKFTLTNQMVPAAGKKSKCKDIILNRTARIFAR